MAKIDLTTLQKQIVILRERIEEVATQSQERDQELVRVMAKLQVRNSEQIENLIGLLNKHINNRKKVEMFTKKQFSQIKKQLGQISKMLKK